MLRALWAPALLGIVVVACSASTNADPAGDDGDGSASSGNAPVTPGASCSNGKKDGEETGVDCGGACATRCAALVGCRGDGDCGDELVCVKDVCVAATSNDKVQNGTETDVDCGGPTAPPCETNKKCKAGKDCRDGICADDACAAPGPDDGVKNGDETDVDCGGAVAAACVAGKGCAKGSDCTSKICKDDVCQAGLADDGVKNGDETDVDCGGGTAPACDANKACVEGARDCKSKVCKAGVCQEPKGDDGVKNGDETDVDCGGAGAGTPRCAAGLGCAVHTDCASNGCAFDKKCAAGRSCTLQHGGVTCGVGEVGAAGANHESCCARAPIVDTAARIDKYHVTAGRMRAFIERTNGNVRAFAKTTAGWNASWDALVPASVEEANRMLGSYWVGAPNDANPNNQSKRSCAPGSFGGHTYFTPRSGDDFSDFTQEQLDVKALNCVGWHLARAFCSWEGGALPTLAQLTNAYTNKGTTTHPWGSGPYSADQQDSRLNHRFNYGFPNVAGRRLLAGGDAADIAWHVSPPGRFPTGRNLQGVEIAGNLLHWASDTEYNFIYTSSWEAHGTSLLNRSWRTNWPDEPNGYYAIGFRCVY
ncbi:MAG: hypothetical protein KIT84_43120 [Labilithrix sp.]|nr:hypothetical protein [Labilithrix sp.]MCW5817872.1 hypothetical protein [Labilithrix sp.]